MYGFNLCMFLARNQQAKRDGSKTVGSRFAHSFCSEYEAMNHVEQSYTFLLYRSY